MTAIFPASARSNTSPPARGCSRTRSPLRTCIPWTSIESTGALSSSSCHSHSFMGYHLYRPQPAKGAMKLHQLFVRQRFRALEYLASAIIRLAHLTFLVVGHGHDAQRQNFVDFSS